MGELKCAYELEEAESRGNQTVNCGVISSVDAYFAAWNRNKYHEVGIKILSIIQNSQS